MTDQEEARPRRWSRWLPTVLAAVVALLLGYAVGVLQPRFSTPGENSPEAGFARDMSEHHAQAVELGMIAARRGADPEIRVLGGDIALTQQAQIGIMATWLHNWHLLPTGTRPRMAWMPDGQQALDATGLMPGLATPDEMAKIRSATDGRVVDELFLQYMLRHHLGGVHMLNGVLDRTDNADVRELAENMRTGQTTEINTLTGLMTRLGIKPLSS